ncbi:MAG TPA: hypothetical protein VFP36_10090 [Usitatibacter sp.]|nr:hypothetical protein [Usitatibacter sp.]
MRMRAAFARVASCAWLLAGCAAVGVPDTTDPWQKFQNACGLMSVGRMLPAEPMLRESLAYYEHGQDPLRLAMVQMQYAVLIESPAFVVSPAFARRREEMGGREALPQRARELNEKARANLAGTPSMAAASPADRTQALILLVEAHARSGDVAEACAALERAAESYEHVRGVHYTWAVYGHASVPEHLADRRGRLGCAGPPKTSAQ